ncbi:MAG: M48 family metallopeptidase [Pseudomonadota bacterium]
MAITTVGLTTHIFNNNLKSSLLLAGFPVLIFAMVLAFYASLYATGYYLPHMADLPPTASGADIFNAAWSNMLESAPFVFGGVAIWFVIAFFLHSRMIRMATGAKPVTRKQYPKIYNMLENLCISRGITMPQFQIIDSPALNAFASGINEKTFTITLTRGIIDALEDDELEAVIAHELSHIMNRDVRLLIVSIIFVGIISFLAEMLFRTLVFGRFGGNRYRRQSSGNRNGGAGLIMIIGLVILVIGYLFAILIRFALSRRREYLADAGAVELTKNPDAMMRALMRISGQDMIKDMPEEVQQMCIENSHNFMGIFATHPPIKDRIKTLSELTDTPIPELPVTLRRPPKRPWDVSA